MKSLEFLFDIQSLILVDIMNTGTRPKYLKNVLGIFFTLKMLNFEKNIERILAEQLSLLVHDNTMITFQKAVGDVFDPVRKDWSYWKVESDSQV